jgi:hypothetical protein
MGDAIKFVATGGIDSAVNALKPKEPPLPKDQEEIDEEAALARKRERDRLRKGAGSNATRKSGSRADALSGSIGKVTLGGVT